MKRVGILHQEFTRTHDAETRSYLVAELHLYLVVVDRQLFITAYFPARDIGNDFLVRGTQAEFALVAVVETQQLRTVLFPAA